MLIRESTKVLMIIDQTPGDFTLEGVKLVVCDLEVCCTFDSGGVLSLTFIIVPSLSFPPVCGCTLISGGH